MIDWDAPTGGYLLQACFATARRAAAGARKIAVGRADSDARHVAIAISADASP